jgi:GcrA cell cycle regulator
VNNAAKYDWNAERVAEVTKLWNDGHTAGEIVKTMPPGLTRSAVLGKVSRLGLLGRRQGSLTISAKQRAALRRPPAAPKPKKPARPAPEPKPPAAKFVPVAPPRELAWVALPHTHAAVPLIELRSDSCRWPVGDELGHFCGAESTSIGKPYCAVHTAMSRGIGTISERAAHRAREVTYA